MVVSVEGQERRLTGTAEVQYESWRQLLREIYEAETGFSQSVDVGKLRRVRRNRQVKLSAHMLELTQGTQLADRYTLVQRLGGSSRQTETWLARRSS